MQVLQQLYWRQKLCTCTSKFIYLIWIILLRVILDLARHKQTFCTINFLQKPWLHCAGLCVPGPVQAREVHLHAHEHVWVCKEMQSLETHLKQSLLFFKFGVPVLNTFYKHVFQFKHSIHSLFYLFTWIHFLKLTCNVHDSTFTKGEFNEWTLAYILSEYLLYILTYHERKWF